MGGTRMERLLRVVATMAVVATVGIAVTGAVVRVTGSGLGCPTWPQCVPGSMVPVARAGLGPVHEWIEYGNRLFSAGVVVIAVACPVIAALARPRRGRRLVPAAVLAAGVLAQAVVGGVTVRTGLLWWTVALHLALSMVLIWVAVLLRHAAVHDTGHRMPRNRVGVLLAAQTVLLAAVVLAGTMVTGAGPHAGNARVARLAVPVTTLAHVHGGLLLILLAFLCVLGVLVRGRPVPRGYPLLVGLVLAQAVIGVVQFATGVPDLLVATHVLGAALVTAAAAALWCAMSTSDGSGQQEAHRGGHQDQAAEQGAVAQHGR